MAQLSKRERPLFAPARVRAWANDEGMKVGVRGRLPEEVVDAYLAHRGSKANREKVGR